MFGGETRGLIQVDVPDVAGERAVSGAPRSPSKATSSACVLRWSGSLTP
jgi:hypothetical protein